MRDTLHQRAEQQAAQRCVFHWCGWRSPPCACHSCPAPCLLLCALMSAHPPALAHTRAVSGRAAAAAAAADAPDAPGGAVPMDDSASDAPEEVAADAAAVLRARKTADATAAAKAACAQMAAAATGPYNKMHSCTQVVLLTDSELWDTLAVNWCKPGAETISDIVDSWEGRDLAACVFRLGLPVIYAKKNYQLHMRRSVVDAALAHARAHPELFDAEVGHSSESETEQKEAEPEQKAASPPQARAAQLQLPSPAPVAPAHLSQRRSPRSPASSRSAAAMAIAALNGFPSAAVSANRAPSRSPAVPGAQPHPREERSQRPERRAPSLPPQVGLLDAGADDSAASSSDDSDDSDWTTDSAVRRGGRMRDEEMNHHLAQAGVERSFAKGFVRNARFAAGGRSMFQLYKEVTASFTHESSKRECLALSRILDALLRGDTAAALEHTCRRLGGVHTAAETGNWAMCERLETEAEQRSFVPDAFMRSALKSVTQMQAVKKAVADGTAARGGSKKHASGKGGSEQRSSSKPFQKSDFNKDTGASASNKKKSGSDSK